MLRHDYIYAYSFFILYVEFRVDLMQSKFAAVSNMQG